MTCRNMTFGLDELVFKAHVDEYIKVDGSFDDICSVEVPRYNRNYHHSVGIASVECCGWLEVSGLLGDSTSQPLIYKTLETLMHHNCIIPDIRDEYGDHVPATKFPLFCVTTSNKVAKWLKDNGWDALKPFVNPNTENKCMPFYWHS